MKSLTSLTLAMILSLSIFGCSSTAEGISQDAERNKAAAEESAKEAGKDLSEAGANVAAATELTPSVKAAMVGNPQLNDPKNSINVDSTSETVTLSGHVYSEEMKALAGKLAQQVLDEAKAKQTLKNELEVTP